MEITSRVFTYVPRAGIEPARPKARDFKSLVSTDSTISAWMMFAEKHKDIIHVFSFFETA